MAATYSAYDEPAPHPYLREPKLYVSGLSGDITKEHLGDLFRYCIPFRPMLQFDADGGLLPGYIEFKVLASAEKALATLQNRPLPADAPTCNIVLSPFPPSTPPTSLPPPSALPRLVKQLPTGITDSDLYDLFRPFGPLANVRSEAGFGPDIGVVEFWSEDDARRAEEAMVGVFRAWLSEEDPDPFFCPESIVLKSETKTCACTPLPPASLLSLKNASHLFLQSSLPPTTHIMASMLTLPPYYPQQSDSSIQVYQPRRAPGAHTDFSANAQPFVPASLMYQQQQQPTPPQNVSQPSHFFPPHFAIPPPVTPQPFSNILSLSSPPANPYAPLPPQRHSPSHSPSLGAQQQLYPFQPPQSTDMYGMNQQQQPQQPNTYGQMTGNTPPQQLQPTPPMTPQRHLQNIGPHHSPFNPMFSTPPNLGNHSRSSSHGSPSNYSPFSLPYTPPHAPFYSPQNGSPPFPRSPPSANSSFVHGPGQQVQYAPAFGPGAGSHSGLIDPCNLFIKNLDPNIDSNELFTSFRRFGHIVRYLNRLPSTFVPLILCELLAHVLCEPKLVRAEASDLSPTKLPIKPAAASAMSAMNGTTLGTKAIIVRLHEPKQLRQEKLANRYSGGRNPHPRSASGATSPSPSDPGEVQSPMERVRRSSGSYYQAALAGTLGLGYQHEELSALSPVVRRDVLTGELTRQVKSLETVPSNDVAGIVESLVNLSLADVVEAIHNQEILKEQVEKVAASQVAAPAPAPLAPGETTLESPGPAAPKPVVPEDSKLLDPSSLSNTPAPPASAPEHPSTPVSTTGSLSDYPRTSSPSGSLLLGSEKDKLLAAVSRVDASHAPDITNLLMSLSKKERAMCLFNPDYLKNKVAEAKAVLEADEEHAEVPASPAPTTAAPTTPAKSTQGLGSAIMSPQTSAISLSGASAAATPEVPGTPAIVPAATVHTLASLARLSATEIIKLANSPNATGLPLAKADPEVVKATDEFIDSLNGQSEQQKKQVVGTKLFKAVKTFGIRNAKITIHLLDTEDLRALTHLMNSYPSVLKEKVQQAAAATAAK
ncbi:hypothetical protein FRC00_013460 [Tulasnella sp. 408]|nr:hypothetical protein FRC00_013460 [Tulasnella sp. 408]